MPNPVEVLTKARAHLVKYGWHQRGIREPRPVNDRSCNALEALWRSVGPVSERGEAQNILVGALPLGWLSVVAYNDAPGRTFEDILALYDRAIELAEREATP